VRNALAIQVDNHHHQTIIIIVIILTLGASSLPTEDQEMRNGKEVITTVICRSVRGQWLLGRALTFRLCS